MVAHKVKLFSQLPLLKSAGINRLAVRDLCIIQRKYSQVGSYLYILHVCVVELFSKMLIFLKEIDHFSEITVIVQSSVLHKV